MKLVATRRVARRLALVGVLSAVVAPAVAQPQNGVDVGGGGGASTDTNMLDPASPLQDLPDFGVDWPDLAVPDGTDQPLSAANTPIDEAAEQHYRVVIEGIDGLAVSASAVHARFDPLSTLVQGKDDPANVAQIDRRAREDQTLMRELLRSYGYYSATVEPRVEATAANGVITVTLAVEAGPLYRFGAVTIEGLPAQGEARLRDAFPVKPGDALDAERVTTAEAAIRARLGREGYAFGAVAAPEIVVDHDTREATLRLDIDAGTPRRFGLIAPKGEEPLFDARHLGRIARFKPGDAYDSARVEDFRRALIQTGLVSTVTLTPVPGDAPDTVDIGVALERAPPRTIAGELGYGTGEGLRAEVSWQHRNLLPPEGAVTFRGVAGTQEQLLGAVLRRSNWPKRDQVLTAQVVGSHTKRTAYDARTFTLGAGIERLTNIIWQKKWTWSAGVELVASDERDAIRATGETQRRTFFIAALPGTLAYDGSDDLLDPTRGYRLAGRLSPEASFQGRAFGYARAQIDGSAYLPLTEKVVVAGRVRLGTILGAQRNSIAPSRRFYAGGGGSVRGYGYQDIGPVDVDGDPIGGRSLAEFSLEARVRFGTFGVVPFVDAGNLYSQTYPDFSGMRYGAGIGARYYTSFGPIRVDVGTPLNRRKGDARVAVYVSLGQAF